MTRHFWTSSSFSSLSSKTGLGIGTLVPVDTLSVGWPVALLISCQLAALTLTLAGGVRPSFGFPAVVSHDGPRCMPSGQGLAPKRPDGAVAKGPEYGGLGDKKMSMGGRNLLVCKVLSPLSLAFWGVWSGCSGPFGPLTPLGPVLGIHGQPLFFPDLPRPWSLPF
jgi:hypothetical protein